MPTIDDRSDTLFQHLTRPEWGLAILAWQRDDKHGFQFQDGQLRIFKAGFLDLLQRVDRPVDETTRVLAELGRAVGRERAAQRIGASQTIPLADQITYFRQLFPKGFQGVNWSRKHRGIDARTERKRHRNPVVQLASDALAPRRLEAHLEGGLASTILDHLCALAGATDLVTDAAVRGLDRVEGVRAEALVRTLAALLSDDSDVKTTFDAWVVALTRALGRKPSWELATAFPALARPDRFTAVKRTTFTRAAAWLAPNLVLEEPPTGAVYQRVLAMMDLLATRLGEAGLRPRDRLDLYDFIQLTLRPKAIAEMTRVEPTTTDAGLLSTG